MNPNTAKYKIAYHCLGMLLSRFELLQPRLVIQGCHFTKINKNNLSVGVLPNNLTHVIFSVTVMTWFYKVIRAQTALTCGKGILPMFTLIWGKHSPVEQSCPVQLGSQLQVPVSARKAPCPEHWSMQEALGLSHPGPPHPTKQWHSPWTHTPRPEHVGSRQSTKRVSKRQCQTHWSPAVFLFQRQPSISIWARVQLQWAVARLLCRCNQPSTDTMNV